MDVGTQDCRPHDWMRLLKLHIFETGLDTEAAGKKEPSDDQDGYPERETCPEQ